MSSMDDSALTSMEGDGRSMESSGGSSGGRGVARNGSLIATLLLTGLSGFFLGASFMVLVLGFAFALGAVDCGLD